MQTAASATTFQPDRRLLEDRVIVVTGGSRGIGSAIVRELVSQGAHVAFTYMNQQALAEKLADELRTDKREVITLQADVRDYGKAKRVINEVVERFGRLDGLVNNAGIVRDKALMMMLPADWHDVVDTNLTGTFNYCRAAIVTFMKQRSGSIVNIASISGVVGVAGQTNYAASKAGIIGLTKALAREVAGHNVTVNAIAPGYIETEMLASVTGARLSGLEKQIPLGKLGRPGEVAGMVAVLLSGVASYVTGQVIVADGGLSLGLGY